MENKSSNISRVLFILTSLLLVASIFVPMWRIELDAPQYPEGLVMKIYPNKLGGQVDIINGLNHYIGMQTLHEENFIEFTILPFIIGFYALIIFIAGLSNKKIFLYIAFIAFLLFGVIAMADFWRWEYNYGHNLDPSAAIIVPGMSYQPPLIGFKQLLNFGAFSVPDIGGWLFIIGGLLMLFAVLLETKVLNKLFKKKISAISSLLVIGILMLDSCKPSGSVPIKLNVDKCDHCEMTISDSRFGAELITKKGRVYKFDDLRCLRDYVSEHIHAEIAHYYIHNYALPSSFIDATKAFYMEGENFKSPMGGNTAAFISKEAAEEFKSSNQFVIKSWNEL